MMASMERRWKPFMTERVTMRVITPKQMPRDERKLVARERERRSTRAKRWETKKSQLCSSS
jgi:adenylosuccinate lyase